MWTRVFVFGLVAYASQIAFALFGIYVLGRFDGALGGQTENLFVGIIASVPVAIILAGGFALSGLKRRIREGLRQSRLSGSAVAGAMASVLFISALVAADALFSVEGRTTNDPDNWRLVNLVDWVSFVSGVGTAVLIGTAVGFALAAASRHESHAA
jgi:hypothetical protein